MPALVLTLLLTGMTPAQLPSLSQVTASETDAGVVMTFRTSEAAVPTPVKRLESPDRLYFDIPGFLPGPQRNWSVGLGPVRRVRAALNQTDPAVTRVVVELAEPGDWSVEPGRSPREFKLIIGVGNAVPGPPSALAAAALRAAEAAPPPLPPPAPDERTRIARRLFALAPALDAMRAWTGSADAEFVGILAESEALAAGARALRVTGSADDLLLSGAADALFAAARARATALSAGDPQARANAMSAAAGALLLIDYVRARGGGLGEFRD